MPAEEIVDHNANHKKHFEIFVDGIKEVWERAEVIAKAIIERAGFTDPEKFVLEALDKRGGKPAAEFQPDEIVNLAEKDRTFFRVTPGGGGRS